MSDATEHIDTIIANAIQTATQQTQEASTAADRLLNQSAGTWIVPPNPDNRWELAAEEPEIPTAEVNEQKYQVALADLIKLLSDQLADFFAKYYPLDNDAFDDAIAWIKDVIQNGGTGIKPEIEDAIWQRGRDRLQLEARAAQKTIIEGSEAKGFVLPAGAMQKSIRMAIFEKLAKSGDASIDISIKQAEIEIDTIKFAVEQALATRQMAMAAASDYIAAIAKMPQVALDVSSVDAGVKAKMMAAAATFYNARLNADELVLKSKMNIKGSEVDIYKNRRELSVRGASVDVQALGHAADVFARTASSALSSLNSIVSSATNAFS